MEFALQPSPLKSSGRLNVPLPAYKEDVVWTPGVAFNGGTTGLTYTTQLGRGMRLGALVVLHYLISINQKGSSIGAAALTGLPYNPTGELAQGGGAITRWAGMASSLVYATVWVSTNPGDKRCSLLGAAAGVTTLAALTDADFANGASLTGTIIYMTPDSV